MSLALHAANTLLLFVALQWMTGAVWRSGFAAALFGLHPLHVESVAWISERKDVLSTFFFMLVLLAYQHYVRRPTWLRYGAVFVLLALGLMSKPMLVSTPLVLLLLDYWPLRRIAHRRVRGARDGGENGAFRKPTKHIMTMERRFNLRAQRTTRQRLRCTHPTSFGNWS